MKYIYKTTSCIGMLLLSVLKIDDYQTLLFQDRQPKSYFCVCISQGNECVAKNN